MALDTIKSKLSEAISIKSEMLSAFSDRGLSVTSSTPFSTFPSLIRSIHDRVQSKEAFPRAEGVTVLPDEGYTALVQVTIPSEPELIPANIAAGHSIYSVDGTATVDDPVVALIENRIYEIVDRDSVITSLPYTLANNRYLTTLSLPALTSLQQGACSSCYNLQTANLPDVTIIPNYAFANCYLLSSASFGTITSVGTNAFNNCRNFNPDFMLSTLVSIGQSAFAGTVITSFPSLYSQTVPSYAYYSCARFSTIPSEYRSTILSITDAAFYGTNLSEIDFPNVKYVGGMAFYSVSTATYVSLPQCSYVGQSAFGYCLTLSYIYLSNISSLGQYAFVCCHKLQTAYLGCSSAHSSMFSIAIFSACYSLHTLIFEGPWWFGNNAVYITSGCSNLYSVYLRHSSVMSVTTGNAANIFYNCPIGNRSVGTKIYVPSSLVTAYKTDAKWSYYSSLFTAEEE